MAVATTLSAKTNCSDGVRSRIRLTELAASGETIAGVLRTNSPTKPFARPMLGRKH
jgi:hypothetical protein